LGSNLTPFPKPIAGAKLVRNGIYSWVRHPLYAGVFLLSLGWALLWHSGPALGMSLMLALFFDIKARGEERRLREKFPEYEDYAKRTRKFIPRVY
jgi:protein-S-isoprenylcysteine O-methyltransferase Ste14